MFFFFEISPLEINPCTGTATRRIKLPNPTSNASYNSPDSAVDTSSDLASETAIRRVSKETGVYTIDSRATAFRRQKYWRDTSKGCQKVDSFIYFFMTYRKFSYGKFTTAKKPVPECETWTIPRVYRQTWRYMD